MSREKVHSDSRMLGRRPRNIVLCADGTGNSGGKGYATNVWRLFTAVDLRSHERRIAPNAPEPKQLAFYDDGVGTEDFKLFKWIGGAFGYGLSRNIRELYETLARNYEPGDRIFVFGFSRGAFTARALAGLIAECGVVDLRRNLTVDENAELRHAASGWRTWALLLWAVGWFRFLARKDGGPAFEQSERIKLLVNAAFNTYQERHKRNSTGSLTWAWFRLLQMLPGPKLMRTHDDDIAAFKQRFSADSRREPLIQCIGVWDTVGAVGAPADWMRAIINWLWSINFHDQRLHPCVSHGFQALAIDDERGTFTPILWDERDALVGRRIEQVWFAGAHSNVGGGYPKQGLANVSLYWMMRRAEFAGLRFQAGELERARGQANVHDKLYDSRAGLASYYSYKPRDIARLVQKHCDPKPALIHYSVFDRIASGAQDYVPANLPARFTVVGDNLENGPQHPEDTDALTYWIERLKDTSIEARKPELTRLGEVAHRWIDARKGLYFAMLASTIAFVTGVWQLKGAEGRPPAPSPHSFDLAALVPEPVSNGVSVVADFIIGTLLPDTVGNYLQPTVDYLSDRPGRFVGCLLVVMAYLQLRGWLLRRTQAPFERFWSPLRGPIEVPKTREQPEPQADEEAASGE